MDRAIVLHRLNAPGEQRLDESCGIAGAIHHHPCRLHSMVQHRNSGAIGVENSLAKSPQAIESLNLRKPIRG
jgi:hypothetical protein